MPCSLELTGGKTCAAGTEMNSTTYLFHYFLTNSVIFKQISHSHFYLTYHQDIAVDRRYSNLTFLDVIPVDCFVEEF